MSWFTSQKSVLLETVEELSPVAASTGKASGYDIVVARTTRRTPNGSKSHGFSAGVRRFRLPALFCQPTCGSTTTSPM